MDIDHLMEYQYDYTKLWIHPWYRLEKNDPTIKFKNEMLQGLFEIYFLWKEKLDAIDEPYYLKIWYYENNFMYSQVVVAVKDKFDWYKNRFNLKDHCKKFDKKLFNKLKKDIEKLNWAKYYDDIEVWRSEYTDKSTYATLKDYNDDQVNFKEYKAKAYKVLIFRRRISRLI